MERPGGRLAVLDFGGDGPGMLLLHGLTGRATTWAGTARRLTRAFHVVAIDQRGHGASDRFGSYSRDDYVEDAAAAIRELGLAPAVVLGHSMGGLNAWVLAARHPQLVAGLVIEDMPSRTAGRGELEGFRKRSGQWPVPFLTLADVRAYFGRERACLGDPYVEVFAESADGYRPIFAIEDMLASVADWDARDYDSELGVIRCPALVVHGALSRNSGTELRAMADRMPHGQYAEVADAGHVIHSENLDGWWAAIKPFLQPLTPRRIEGSVASGDRP
ncbi:MAG: alpha/beta hydrolase [Candidatus Limnocylindrales bacterium]